MPKPDDDYYLRAPSLKNMLANLGIQGGWSCPSVKLAGNVFLLTSNLASYANPEEAIPLASRALTDIGNVRKLRESGHDRRHLFDGSI